jgi:hypothetical protein
MSGLRHLGLRFAALLWSIPRHARLCGMANPASDKCIVCAPETGWA